MENRTLLLVACLIFLALPGFALSADVGNAEQRADWAQRLGKAQAMVDEGKAHRVAAAKIRADKDAECPKRFRVTACLAENNDAYMLLERQANGLENEGLAIKREILKEQLQEKDAQHQAETARREAELGARASATTAARQKETAGEDNIRAKKARQAEIGRQRKLADEQKLHRKQVAHNAQVAEKMEKAHERAGQSGSAAK
jgi:colicin import membrane protein